MTGLAEDPRPIRPSQVERLVQTLSDRDWAIIETLPHEGQIRRVLDEEPGGMGSLLAHLGDG